MEACLGSADPDDVKLAGAAATLGVFAAIACAGLFRSSGPFMPDSQPCGRIVVCTGDGIHAARADALDDAIAQPGGRRLRSLHDASPGGRGSLKLNV